MRSLSSTGSRGAWPATRGHRRSTPGTAVCGPSAGRSWINTRGWRKPLLARFSRAPSSSSGTQPKPWRSPSRRAICRPTRVRISLRDCWASTCGRRRAGLSGLGALFPAVDRSRQAPGVGLTAGAGQASVSGGGSMKPLGRRQFLSVALPALAVARCSRSEPVPADERRESVPGGALDRAEGCFAFETDHR